MHFMWIWENPCVENFHVLLWGTVTWGLCVLSSSSSLPLTAVVDVHRVKGSHRSTFWGVRLHGDQLPSEHRLEFSCSLRDAGLQQMCVRLLIQSFYCRSLPVCAHRFTAILPSDWGETTSPSARLPWHELLQLHRVCRWAAVGHAGNLSPLLLTAGCFQIRARTWSSTSSSLLCPSSSWSSLCWGSGYWESKSRIKCVYVIVFGLKWWWAGLQMPRESGVLDMLHQKEMQDADKCADNITIDWQTETQLDGDSLSERVWYASACLPRRKDRSLQVSAWSLQMIQWFLKHRKEL